MATTETNAFMNAPSSSSLHDGVEMNQIVNDSADESGRGGGGDDATNEDNVNENAESRAESDHNDNMEKMVFKTRSSWISHFKITPLRGIKEDFRNRIAYYRDDWTADGPIGTKTAKGGEIGDDSATEKETNDPRRPGLVPKHIQFLSSSFCFV